MPRYKRLLPEVRPSKMGGILIHPHKRMYKMVLPELPEGKQRFKTGSMGTVYMKSVVLPYYRDSIKVYQKEVRSLNAQLAGLQRKCNVIMRSNRTFYKKQANKELRAYKTKFREKVNEKADDLASKKLYFYRKRASKYMDGMFISSALHLYASKNNLNNTKMSILITIHLAKTIRKSQICKWSFFSNALIHINLAQLTQEGYINKGEGLQNNLYSLTMKSKKIIAEFQYFYTNMLKEFMGTDKYKEKGYEWPKIKD